MGSVDQTVLANEQVIDGKGWRTGATVEKKNLSQWFLKSLIMQKSYFRDSMSLSCGQKKLKQCRKIGCKSTGAEIQFQVKETNQLVNIYTTRPDTIYGASFIAVSINHPLVNSTLNEEKIKEIKEEFTKNDDEKIKLGIPLNIHCRHPLLDKDLPIYIANFVLDNYGEGAIFGCPAHDERDFEFAQKYQLPIIKVLDCPEEDIPYLSDGKMINSEELNGLDKNCEKKKQ